MTCSIITTGLSRFWKLQVYSFSVSSGLAFRNQLTDYLIFYIIFLLMRKYGGGFHFRDFLPCFITSILSLRGILELLQYIRLEILPCTLISSLSLLFIFLIAPVPSIAEDFTTEELRIRKYKLLHIIWIMEVFIIFWHL